MASKKHHDDRPTRLAVSAFMRESIQPVPSGSYLLALLSTTHAVQFHLTSKVLALLEPHGHGAETVQAAAQAQAMHAASIELAIKHNQARFRGHSIG
jgi:hypothetical protein